MVTPHRSASVDALYRNGLTVWPGMTIFWIGDLAHQGEVSGHNPDDFPPLRAEQVDSDLDPEVRALDFMIGPAFTARDAAALVGALTTGVDKRRVYYVIYNRKIYRKATGFVPEPYSGGDPHTNHVHFSGLAVDDANGSDWRSVLALGEEPPLTPEEIEAVATATWAKRLRSPSLGREVAASDWLKDAYSLSHDRVGGEVAILNRIEATLDKIVSAPPGGLTEDQVRAIVREELDQTKLSQG